MRTFDSAEIYEKHVKSNRCKTPYTCEVYDYCTNRKDNYEKHMNSQKCKDKQKTAEKKKLYACPDCQKPFRDNYLLSRHLNRKVPCNVVVRTIYPKNNKIDTIQHNYIYLLQDRTSVKLNDNIYKIGKTKQSNLKRFTNYPKGYRVLLLVTCVSDCDIVESKLIEFIKRKYIQIEEYGREYFQGNIECMMKDVFEFANRPEQT